MGEALKFEFIPKYYTKAAKMKKYIYLCVNKAYTWNFKFLLVKCPQVFQKISFGVLICVDLAFVLSIDLMS